MRTSIFSFISVLMMLFAIIMPSLFPANFIYIFIVMSVIISLFASKDRFQLSTIGYILAFIFIILVYDLFNKGNLAPRQNIYQYTVAIGTILLSQVIYQLNKKEVGLLFCISLFSILYLVINTMLLGIEDPLLVRSIFSDNDNVEIDNNTMQGIISYSVAHQISCIPPIFVFLSYKVKNLIPKIMYALFAFIILLMLMQMVITTAFLLSLISTIIIIFKCSKEAGFKYLIFLLLIIFIVALVFNINFTYTFETSSLFDDKIEDLQATISGNKATGQVENRTSLYEVSLRSIFRNPILGLATTSEIGLHSFFLDYFALYGIFSFLLFGAIKHGVCKNIKKMFPLEKDIVIVCLIPIIVLIFTKSPIFMSNYFFAMFVLIPLFFRFYNLHIKDNE